MDPVLSDHAAPVSFAVKAFPGTTFYTADDFPDIDLLIISHDHWDHLDYPTVSALQPKIKQIFVPLGMGADFERWGYTAAQINEADWWQTLELGDVTAHLVPSRH